MSRFAKFTKFAALALVFDVLIGIALVIFGVNHFTQPEPETKTVTKLVIPTNCWTGGEGHPYPNLVLHDGELLGQKAVDSIIGEMFENRPGPYDPSKVGYFCKRG